MAQRFARGGIGINLDVRWVLGNPHWTVRVTKVAANVFYQSQVLWNVRQIELSSHEFQAVDFSGTNGSALPRRQVTVAHEFGHAAGNTSVLSRGDEYRPTSPPYTDPRIIMHTSSEMRSRHFRTIIEELDKMVPATTFQWQASR